MPFATPLIGDIRALVEETRSAVAVTVNAGMTLLYWRIGKRICEDILGNERAGYGDEMVATLSRQLTTDYGRGFSEKSLRHMILFSETFPELEIVSTLSRQLILSYDRRTQERSARYCSVTRFQCKGNTLSHTLISSS